MNAIPSHPKADLRTGRIKKVSEIFRAITAALLIVYGVGVIAEVFVLLVAVFHLSALRSQIFPNGRAFTLMLVAFMVALNFFRLFSRLKDGQLFEGQTIGFLERAGKWWIALGIVQLILPPNQTILSMATGAAGNGIFCGLVVFFIAWVLREGQKLKEEQELVV
jgi:hypothetical protein